MKGKIAGRRRPPPSSSPPPARKPPGALRGWARYRNTTVTATETPSRPGTWLARLTWHHDGIEFEAYAHITAAPGQETPQ